MAFLEERLPTTIDWGGSFAESHAVEIVTTSNGSEYRSLKHPFVRLSYDIAYKRDIDFVRAKILDLYSRANGMYRGFRVKDIKDYTTNGYSLAPTAFDQPLILSSAGVYQLVRWYGNSADATCARRLIRKPVAGTTLIGVAGQSYPSAQWSVDNTTGLVTMAANKVRNISAITQAAQAVVTVGSHTFVTGNSVVFSGVVGMTQINSVRAPITATSGTTITVAINSTAFSAYTSNGTVQTQPIAGEVVTGGCEFDIPCRFDSDLGGAFSDWGTIAASGIRILELLNP